jgi:hypothetical protein
MQLLPPSKLSYFIRRCLHIIARLMGAHKQPKGWRFDGLITSGWVFILGLPIGAMIVGSSFSLALWAIVVVVMTIMVNFDDAVCLAQWMKQNNLDGEVEEKTNVV